MNNNKKVKIFIYLNILLMIFIITPIILLNDGTSKYFRFGWYDDLYIISIQINTKLRYITANCFIVFIKIVDVLICEISKPILYFNIYSSDKNVIDDFTKNELQICGNTMSIIEAVKYIALVIISITQIDIALLSMLFGEITTIFTVRMLLNNKKFKKSTLVDDLPI